MLKRKYYLYLDESEHSLLGKSLVQLKNKLARQSWFVDCVDELIKVSTAHVIKI